MAKLYNIAKYQINLQNPIGRGSFGCVYGNTDRGKSPSKVAKQCHLDKSKSEEEINRRGNKIMIEIQSMQRLREHPHVMELLDFAYQDNSFWLIMKFCELGDLNQFFKKGKVDFALKMNIMYQMATAVDFMHNNSDKPVVHRDLKPSNVLLLHSDNGQIVAKISDFGLAKIFDVDVAETFKFHTKCGTPGFMAPELFSKDNKELEMSVDIFALGCIFLAVLIYEQGNDKLSPLCGGSMDIGSEMELFKKNSKELKRYCDVIPTTTDHHYLLKELIGNMIKYEPIDRIKAEYVVLELQEIGTSPYELPNPAGTHKEVSTDSKQDSGYQERATEAVIAARECARGGAVAGDVGIGSLDEAECLQAMHRHGTVRPSGNKRGDVCLVGSDGKLLSREEAIKCQGLQYRKITARIMETGQINKTLKQFYKHDHVKMISDPSLAVKLQQKVIDDECDTISKVSKTSGIIGIVTDSLAGGRLVNVEFATSERFFVSSEILEAVDFSGCWIEQGDYVLVCKQGCEMEDVAGNVKHVGCDFITVDHGQVELKWKPYDLTLIAKIEDREEAFKRCATA